MLLNGGPLFKFNEATSLVVTCEAQHEVDLLYVQLSADPAEEVCGWLKARYGLSWQILHSGFEKMVKSGDKVRFNRVMMAVMQMKRIDINVLQRAWEGE